MRDKDTVVADVKQRLIVLHSLKQHKYKEYWEVKNKYKLLEQPEFTEDGYVDYSMNTQCAVVDTKASEILANTPKFDFVALDEEAKRYKRIRQLFWDYVWLVSETDKAIYSTVMDALKIGSGFAREDFVRDKRTVKMPKLTADGILWTEEEKTEYVGCKLSHIPWENVWVNGRDSEHIEEGFIVTHYNAPAFKKKFVNNNIYSFNINDIPVGKHYYVGSGETSLTVGWSSQSTATGTNAIDNGQIYSVLEYWNKYDDEYVVLANGVWINQMSDGSVMPNPSIHKEVPILVYTDIYIDDDIYWCGEFSRTSKSSKLKNTARSLAIEVVKAQGGIITIDPDSEFDENIMELGIRKYARVEKDAFGFFAPPINANSLQYVEGKADEDIIIESGIDFRNQLLSPWETATKTQGRIQAALKRISLGIKWNAYTFYKRLAKLRTANMEFYKNEDVVIQTKWMEVDWEGNVKYLNNGYWVMAMKPEYFSGKFSIFPIIDSMVGNTSAENKEKWLQTSQLLMNMVNPDTGKPMYHPAKIIESGRGIIDEVIDIDKLSEKTGITQSPDDIMKELDMADWISPQDGWASADFVPPAQRSGAPVLLPSSPNTPE